MADSPNTTSPSRRTVLAGISVAAAPVAAAVEKSVTIAGDDPIFGVIAEHRAAQEALHAAGSRPEYDESEWERADTRACAAELPLFATEPTTIAGIASLLLYVGSDAHRELQGAEEQTTTVLSYAYGWTGNPDLLEATRTFPRRVGATLRNLITAA